MSEMNEVKLCEKFKDPNFTEDLNWPGRFSNGLRAQSFRNENIPSFHLRHPKL